MMYIPYGMIAALPTPFREQGGSVDLDGFKKIMDHVMEGGMHCLCVGGSTGEYHLMTTEERKSIIKVACEHVNKKVPIMAGTSGHTTKETIELTQYAAEVGADAALVVTPFYMQTSRQGIIDYYKEIALNSSIGIVIYHYPSATNVVLDPELIHELSQIDGVVALKNTATDQEHICKVIALTKDNKQFSVITGFEHLILPTFAVGGSGAMGIIHNLVPKEIVKLYNLVVKENDLEAAIKLNQKLIPLYEMMEVEPFPGPVKAGLEILGLPGGKVRPPLTQTSDELKARIKVELEKLGYVKEKSVSKP